MRRTSTHLTIAFLLMPPVNAVDKNSNLLKQFSRNWISKPSLSLDMSGSVCFTQSLTHLQYPRITLPELPSFTQNLSVSGLNLLSSSSSSLLCSTRLGGRFRVLNALSGKGSLQELDGPPVSIELQQVCSETQFDQVIADAQKLEEPVIFVWMAGWCRKCIYLKPKLEKLAAEYYPRLRFYGVDVNKVPHKLVTRAGVTKMPTIQLWKDCKKHDEVIGGHKAHLVVTEVRQMIENENTLSVSALA